MFVTCLNPKNVCFVQFLHFYSVVILNRFPLDKHKSKIATITVTKNTKNNLEAYSLIKQRLEMSNSAIRCLVPKKQKNNVPIDSICAKVQLILLYFRTTS